MVFSAGERCGVQRGGTRTACIRVKECKRRQAAPCPQKCNAGRREKANSAGVRGDRIPSVKHISISLQSRSRVLSVMGNPPTMLSGLPLEAFGQNDPSTGPADMPLRSLQGVCRQKMTDADVATPSALLTAPEVGIIVFLRNGKTVPWCALGLTVHSCIG